MSLLSSVSRSSQLASVAFLVLLCLHKEGESPLSGGEPLLLPVPSIQRATESAKQSPLEFPIDQMLVALREQWVFRKEIAWEVIETEIRAKVAKAATIEDKAKVIRDVFARVNDVHSVLLVQGKSFSHYEALDEPTRQKLGLQMNRSQEQSGKVVAKLLDGRIGYVLVPAMQVGTREKVVEAARGLYEKVRAVSREKPKGWIVDLRLNTGGNLTPMLTGLRLLLGDGVVGGTIDADGRTVQEWVLKPDGLYWRDGSGDRRFVELDMSADKPDLTLPVAVLLGPITMSSGQGTALAFRGRPRCHLIGEPTAKGYTTVTNPLTFGRDVMMSLSVGFMADRMGKPCQLQVLPDQAVEGGDTFEALVDDRKVQAAISWLNLKDK